MLKKNTIQKNGGGSVNICALFSFHRKIGVHGTFQNALIEM